MPSPEVGLVIAYDYLWSHEAEKGLEFGRKTRPAVIILAIKSQSDGSIRVSVAPVTHSRPDDPRLAVAMPQQVKNRLKLDHLRSWIMYDELNHFDWPGHDIRPLPKGTTRSHYGTIPPQLYEEVLARIRELAATRRLKNTARD
jgi:hypothetical protein